MFKEIGYIIVTTSFVAKYEGMKTKFSLNMLTNVENLERYLVIHQIVVDRLERMARTMKRLIEQDASIQQKFGETFLPPIIRNLEDIFYAQFPTVIYDNFMLSNEDSIFSKEFVSL